MAQSDALDTDLTARENLEFFGAIYGLTGPALKVAAERALATAHLTVEPRKQARDYSGGMRRRLSLATALLHQPELLILDEPTIGLDPLHRVDIWKSFRSMAAGGATLIVTTHEVHHALGKGHVAARAGEQAREWRVDHRERQRLIATDRVDAAGRRDERDRRSVLKLPDHRHHGVTGVGPALSDAAARGRTTWPAPGRRGTRA